MIADGHDSRNCFIQYVIMLRKGKLLQESKWKSFETHSYFKYMGFIYNYRCARSDGRQWKLCNHVWWQVVQPWQICFDVQKPSKGKYIHLKQENLSLLDTKFMYSTQSHTKNLIVAVFVSRTWSSLFTCFHHCVLRAFGILQLQVEIWLSLRTYLHFRV